MTYEQAQTIANLRARRTGIRQRVALCICGDVHFTVRAVDRIPAAAMA